MNPQPSCITCGASRRRTVILHNLRNRATNRLFCTNCLLKNHHGDFCPICFHVYDEPPPPHLRLICLRCPAIVHRSCATDSDGSPAPRSFKCPVCADPNFSYFKPIFQGGSVDAQSAKVLVAATRIASQSMCKAAVAARLEAERLAKEAAAARKKAREALEQLARIVAMEEKDRLVEHEEQQKRLRMV